MKNAAIILLPLLFFAALQPLATSSSTTSSPQIKHVVIIMQENHSFDNYFGTFPGANGIQNDPPSVHPFHITGPITDLCHATECARADYDNGKMDGFLAAEGNQTFGYYDQSDIPYYWSLAENYTLFDNYFTSEMGPSLPNHLYVVAGTSGGITGSIGSVLPTLQVPTIMGRLQEAGLTWSYYSPYYIGNENGLGLISSIANNTAELANEKNTYDFVPDVKGGQLSTVTWIMPTDSQSEHPPYNLQSGEAYVESIIDAIQESPFWSSTVIFLTWDDYGGWYDHVVPPQVDRYGYGFRTPLIMISPFVKHGFIDHTLSDHTSMVKFVERVFNLDYLSTRDRLASDLTEALNYGLSSHYADDALDLVALPVQNLTSTLRTASLTYQYNLSGTQNATVYAVFRNGLNQTTSVLPISATFQYGKVHQIVWTIPQDCLNYSSITFLPISPDGQLLANAVVVLGSNSTSYSVS